MPSFILPQDPPCAGPDVGDSTQACPYARSQTKWYKVLAIVKTRAGDIPVRGAKVRIDGTERGTTDEEGKTPEVPPSQKPSATIEVTYENSTERLKREVFTVALTGINADTKAFTAARAKTLITRVRDVFGSGEGGFGGDEDFRDEYTVSAKMDDTGDPDIKLITVDVKLATLSLTVPYLSQVGPGETIQIDDPTPADPGTDTFAGSRICAPTSAKMYIDYWGITAAGGGDLSRNALMQECWDTKTNPSTTFPCPWQIWEHLRATVADLVEAAHPNVYEVTPGPSSAGDSSIPSAYADNIVKELTKGRPVVNSTYATDAGHVMIVRGAVIKHDGTAQWLIFNDPYGNLASTDSIYDRLDISTAVGLRTASNTGAMNAPRDVRAVREVLSRVGHYAGSLDGPMDENNVNDATVKAIFSFQGAGGDGWIAPGGATERRLNKKLAANTASDYRSAENEPNNASGAGSDRGRHVYYNGTTEADGVDGVEQFRLKGGSLAMVVKKVTPLTNVEVRQKLVPGQ